MVDNICVNVSECFDFSSSVCRTNVLASISWDKWTELVWRENKFTSVCVLLDLYLVAACLSAQFFQKCFKDTNLHFNLEWDLFVCTQAVYNYIQFESNNPLLFHDGKSQSRVDTQTLLHRQILANCGIVASYKQHSIYRIK